MKPHPRIRKTIKWGGLLITILACILSLPLSFVISSVHPGESRADDSFVAVLCGIPVGCFVFPLAMRCGVSTRPRDCIVTIACGFALIEFVTYLGWMPWYRSVCGAPPAGFVCFEGSLTIVAIIAGLSLRSLFPILPWPMHLCPKCSYDRTGLAVGAVCPECGAAP